MPRALSQDALQAGARWLADIDADLAAVFGRVGVPPLWGRRPGFPALIRIILEQQVSLAAARTMYRKLLVHAGEMTPVRIQALGVDGLRKLGLTRQKARYCFGLAERVVSGSLDLAKVARSPDHIGRKILMEVPGIGPWSVDIYYLMALRRPDVWPQGDLALAVALRELKGLDRLPDKDEQERMAAAWSPCRSIAARLVWAHYLAGRGQYAAAS
jgi:DNA-3-methyladenine glycosylase II